MAIYSMNNNRFAGPKSDTPWKPSPAMKMRQAAAADRVQTSAKQDALDFKSDAANAKLRQQVEAATLRQQLFGLNQMKQQQRTLGRNLPLSSGPTTNTAPRPTTLGLPQGAFESSQPVSAGLASRNALNAPSTGGSTERQPTTPSRTKRPSRPGRRAGKGSSTFKRQGPSRPMEPKYGKATGANPDYKPGDTQRTNDRLRAMGSGPGSGIAAASMAANRAASMAASQNPARKSGGGTRGASPMLPKPVLGGANKVTAPGGVLGQTWAGDDKARNNRPSDLAAVGNLRTMAGKTGKMTLHTSTEPTYTTLGRDAHGVSTTSSGPGPDRLPAGSRTQPGFDKDAWKKRNRNRGSSGSRGGSSSSSGSSSGSRGSK